MKLKKNRFILVADNDNAVTCRLYALHGQY